MEFNADYLEPILQELTKQWPDNRRINIVCHGHSVPAGYFTTPCVNTFSAYPHLLHQKIKERFPFAVTNVIVTAVGGEHAKQGAMRFKDEVLSLNPDVVIIDYSLNDRMIGLEEACKAWSEMIEKALEKDIKVILCTPTWDYSYYDQDENWEMLKLHAKQVRGLATQYKVGLADSFEAFQKHVIDPADLTNYLSSYNHPSKEGHELVAREIAKYFLSR